MLEPRFLSSTTIISPESELSDKYFGYKIFSIFSKKIGDQNYKRKWVKANSKKVQKNKDVAEKRAIQERKWPQF